MDGSAFNSIGVLFSRGFWVWIAVVHILAIYGAVDIIVFLYDHLNITWR